MAEGPRAPHGRRECWQRSGLGELFVLRAAASAAPRPPEKPVLPRGRAAMKVLLPRYEPGRETRHKPSFHVSAPKPQHAALRAGPAALLCLSSSRSSPRRGRAAGPGSPTPNARGKKTPLPFGKSCKALPRAGAAGARSLCSQISKERGVLERRERRLFISFKLNVAKSFPPLSGCSSSPTLLCGCRYGAAGPARAPALSLDSSCLICSGEGVRIEPAPILPAGAEDPALDAVRKQ